MDIQQNTTYETLLCIAKISALCPLSHKFSFTDTAASSQIHSCVLMSLFAFHTFHLVVQLMALVASTLLDLVKNLRAFAGVLVVSDNSIIQSTSFSVSRVSSQTHFRVINLSYEAQVERNLK